MKAWIKLISLVLLVWCFVHYAPVVLNNVKAYRQIVDYSEQKGIDNAALFYSEEPFTSLAEQELKEKIRLKK